ncbi:unnamed protein product [Adineta ricciae]|uniref:Uncharacterized protein n=2 Tax=Adineta ricciae TaxID=249248 RepID=A0A814NWG5_ADIRI|nr:unnamed protein product [Adineta ricciae]
MKFLVNESAYPLYEQEQMEFLHRTPSTDDKEHSSSIETLENVLANRFFSPKKSSNILSNYLNTSLNEKQFNQFCSSLSKRIRTCSLSKHTTMAITAIASFSEEQTNSVECDNTYLSSDETSRLDDLSSLTTITSNLPKERSSLEQNTSIYADTTFFNSDIDDISDEMISYEKLDNAMEINFGLRNSNDQPNNEEITPIPDDFHFANSNFDGLVHAIKYTVISEKEEEEQQADDDDNQQTLSDYDNVSHSSDANKKIRSNVDIVSANLSMTSTMQHNYCSTICFGEQLNKQVKTIISEHNDSDDDDYIIVDQRKPVVQMTTMTYESEFGTDDEFDQNFQSANLFDNEPLSASLSDISQDFDNLGYSSDAIQSDHANDDLNDTNAHLREEALSLTKVRCKPRQSWIQSSTSLEDNSLNLSKSFVPKPSVGGSGDGSNVIVNTTICTKTPAAMPLQKNSIDCNKSEKRHAETPPYGFLQLNHDLRSIKTDDSTLSPISKTNNIPDKDVLSASKKTDNFYLIHHQSSLIPIKDLLNQKNLNTNIEIIQMDEQECILEIVDGVIKLVPKDKSHLSSPNTDDDKSDAKQKSSIEYETSNNYDSPERTERSSSVASSISTPPLSEHEHESEDKLSVASVSNKDDDHEENQEPFILCRDIPSKTPPLQSQFDQSVDLLDLFSTPPVPQSHSNTDNNKYVKNLLDDSLSSASSYEQNGADKDSISHSSEQQKERSPSPVGQPLSKSSSSTSISMKDDNSSVSPTNQVSELVKSIPVIEKPSLIDEPELEYPLPKSEPPPTAKPINKARINEFASLLSSSVHLTQLQAIKKPDVSKETPVNNRPPPSPLRSDEQSYSSIRSVVASDRDQRESYQTVKSNNTSQEEQTKKPIDARYNEKIDDRSSIQINTSNIKALFEQKISDTNKLLSQSNEHLLHSNEAKQQHKKVPISYGSLKRNLPINPVQTNQVSTRRQSYQDMSSTNKYAEHIAGAKDVVIEDKQPEHGHQTAQYGNGIRRHNTEEIIRPGIVSSRASPDSTSSNNRSESLIAREIRETQEKEEELRRQRRSCGLPEDLSSLSILANSDPIKPDASSSTSTKAPVKSSSFLSNLDFFTSKENTGTNSTFPSRRSTTTIPNIAYDSQGSSTNNESKPITNIVAQELSRFNGNGIPIIRTSSSNNYIQRSSSNQNIFTAQNTNNVIQREIEAIRTKEAELRELGRIQHTSDEHSDPRKYQEYISTLPKSQSNTTLSMGKAKRDTERMHRPIIATSNGFLQSKPISNTSSLSSLRGRFPSPNPTAPIISSSNKSTDYSKLSSTDRLELEKRECQEREQELRKQRHSVNGDSGNGSQDEHDDDQERYSDKIERLKRKENEKAQAPLVRPTKKLDMCQRWEQMLTNKNAQQTVGDEHNDDD